MKPKEKVCHVTSVHPAGDIRIFWKECRSLAQAGYETVLIAPGTDHIEKEGIKIIGAGINSGSRIFRMFRYSKKVALKVLDQKPALVHFHDPELLLYAAQWKKAGIKVVFDVHEDVAGQILTKPWIPWPIRKFSAFVYNLLEKRLLKHVDAVVTVTPFLVEMYRQKGIYTIQVTNYPLMEEFENIPVREPNGKPVFILNGLMNSERGIDAIVRAVDSVKGDFTVYLAGKFYPPDLEEELKQLNGWKKVTSFGQIDRQAIRKLLFNASAGLAIYLKTMNNFRALPTKIFEFMAAGIPIIASDLPLLKKLVEEQGCGICVPAYQPEAIAEAMNYIIENPGKAKAMGEKGRKVFLEKYNFGTEKKKLLDLYQQLNIQ